MVTLQDPPCEYFYSKVNLKDSRVNRVSSISGFTFFAKRNLIKTQAVKTNGIFLIIGCDRKTAVHFRSVVFNPAKMSTNIKQFSHLGLQ